MTNENLALYQDAYEIGPEKIIDTYAEATKHVDQGLSLTLFFPDTATTRDINKAQIYAWKKASRRCTTSACASWRWKVLKSRAACPARCKEKRMKPLSRVSAVNWNKFRMIKILRSGTA
jgi:ribonucleoside-diphosphate reductase alpha chain